MSTIERCVRALSVLRSEIEARRVERVRGPRGATESITNYIFYIIIRYSIIFLLPEEKDEYHQERRAAKPTSKLEPAGPHTRLTVTKAPKKPTSKVKIRGNNIIK